MSRRSRRARTELLTAGHHHPMPVAPRAHRGSTIASLFRGLLLAAATVVLVVATILTLPHLTAKKIAGQATSNLFDPSTVDGLPITDIPSGPRDNAPAPVGDIQRTDGSDNDKLALLAANDIADYWQSHYDGLDGVFRPITNFASYDSRDKDTPKICGESPAGNPNAFFCPSERVIAWDRGVMLPIGEKYFGKMSIVALLAHEYGHAVQKMAGLVNPRTPTIVSEQQADCFAGLYMRWVSEGSSSRFTINTGDALNKVLAATIAIRDPLITPKYKDLVEEGHGTALDRLTAFQRGFVTGISACTEINIDEIYKRRGELPIALRVDDDGHLENDNAPINEDTLNTLMELLNHIYNPTQAPKIDYQPAQCADAKQSDSPVGYCPATNTITVDLPALAKIGAPEDESNKVLLQGDNTALSLVTSRYMMALQHARGVAIDNPTAAMRTACLTGAADRAMNDPVTLKSGKKMQLTAGDLDEAVSGLLTNGWAASDVNGDKVQAGFTRIMAFRAGLLNTADGCFAQFKDA